MQIQIDGRGRGLLERIVYGVLLLAVLALGFFFLVAALIAGAVVATAILLRLWWLKRKLAKAAEDEYITTDYHVVGHEQIEARPEAGDPGPERREPGR